MDKWYVRAALDVYLTQTPNKTISVFSNYFATAGGSVATFGSREAAEEVARRATEADRETRKGNWKATPQPPPWPRD